MNNSSELPCYSASELISELEKATRRPLLTEILSPRRRRRRKKAIATTISSSTSKTRREPIGIGASSTENKNGHRQRAVGHTTAPLSREKKSDEDDEGDGPPPTWLELVQIATILAPTLTEDQHGRVMHLVTILLLGFLLPQSTGAELELFDGETPLCQDFDPDMHILNHTLERRLALLSKTNRVLPDVHDLETFEYSPVDNALTDFLLKGLKPLLLAREAHRSSVDILHLLAMMIHPQPRQFPAYIQGRSHWKFTQDLLESGMGRYFEIGYEKRLVVAKLVEESLVLPSLNEANTELNAHLLDRAVPHILASLQEFRQYTAQCGWDSHVAYAAVVSLTVQTDNVKLLLTTWKQLFTEFLDDPGLCSCSPHDTRGCSTSVRSSYRTYSLIPGRANFCRHRERGLVLTEFIRRCGITRRKRDRRFHEHLVVSVAEALENEYEKQVKRSDQMDIYSDQSLSPCFLASLLAIASMFFPLLNGPDEICEDDPYDTILRHTIDFLSHPVALIRESASSALVSSLEGLSTNSISRYVGSIGAILLHMDHEAKQSVCIVNLMCLLTSKSNEFTEHLVQLYGKGVAIPSSWIAILCRSSTVLLSPDLEKLQSLLLSSCGEREDIMASILALRGSQYFQHDKKDQNNMIDQETKGHSAWRYYQLARHATVVGSFRSAAIFLSSIERNCDTETSYFWLQGLYHLNCAEALLNENKAFAIPQAITHFEDAMCYLKNMDRTKNKSCSVQFQVDMIRHRIDFLALLTVLRQITSEMKLTGEGPKKTTRPHRTLRNLVHLFAILARRLSHLSVKHGLNFQYPGSFLSIFIHELCSLFMADATARMFKSYLSSVPDPVFRLEKAKAVRQHFPMASLLCRMHDFIENIDDSAPPVARAETLLELMNRILMCPAPYSKDFFVVKPMSHVSFSILSNGRAISLDENVIKGKPIIPTSFDIYGNVPEDIFASARVPFHSILLWYRLRFVRHLQGNTEGVPEASADISKRIPVIENSPLEAKITRGGLFTLSVECPPIADGGHFAVDMKLGCRNIKGEEFHLATDKLHSTLSINLLISSS